MKALKDYLAALFGKKQEPDAEVNALKERLDGAYHLLDTERTINAELNLGYGYLKKHYDAKLEDAQQTIACLVSMMGNNVIINIDLVKAMKQSDLYINYSGTDDGVLVQLLTEEEVKVLQEQAKQQEAAQNA